MYVCNLTILRIRKLMLNKVKDTINDRLKVTKLKK